MLKGQTCIHIADWERGGITGRKEHIIYLPVWYGEPFTGLLEELPSPDTSPASVQSPDTSPGLAVLPQSVLFLTSPSNAGGISAVTWHQWPTAKVKVEAGMGIVT